MNELLNITKFENATNMFLFFFFFSFPSFFPFSFFCDDCISMITTQHYNFKYLCILYDSDIRPCLNR